MLTRIPNPEEVAALEWVKANVNNWREKLSMSFDQHVAQYRVGMLCSSENWANFYERPFGRQDWNDYLSAVRKMLADGLLPEVNVSKYKPTSRLATDASRISAASIWGHPSLWSSKGVTTSFEVSSELTPFEIKTQTFAVRLTLSSKRMGNDKAKISIRTAIEPVPINFALPDMGLYETAFTGGTDKLAVAIVRCLEWGIYETSRLVTIHHLDSIVSEILNGEPRGAAAYKVAAQAYAQSSKVALFWAGMTLGDAIRWNDFLKQYRSTADEVSASPTHTVDRNTIL